MGIIPKEKTQKEKIIIIIIEKKCTRVSCKKFGSNGVGLHVKRRLDVLYVQHLVHQTIKLAVTFLQNFKKVVSLCSVVAMLCLKVFPNC